MLDLGDTVTKDCQSVKQGILIGELTANEGDILRHKTSIMNDAETAIFKNRLLLSSRKGNYKAQFTKNNLDMCNIDNFAKPNYLPRLSLQLPDKTKIRCGGGSRGVGAGQAGLLIVPELLKSWSDDTFDTTEPCKALFLGPCREWRLITLIYTATGSETEIGTHDSYRPSNWTNKSKIIQSGVITSEIAVGLPSTASYPIYKFDESIYTNGTGKYTGWATNWYVQVRESSVPWDSIPGPPENSNPNGLYTL